MKKMQQINPQDRPREKLHAKGAVALSDFELLKRASYCMRIPALISIS